MAWWPWAQPLAVSAVDNGVELSWEADASLADGYNLYRRVPGTPAVRLNDALLEVRAGGVRFVDPGVGLAAGQTVYYSFALVRGGVEIGFSEEVRVAFASGVPVRSPCAGTSRTRSTPPRPSASICPRRAMSAWTSTTWPAAWCGR